MGKLSCIDSSWDRGELGSCLGVVGFGGSLGLWTGGLLPLFFLAALLASARNVGFLVGFGGRFTSNGSKDEVGWRSTLISPSEDCSPAERNSTSSYRVGIV
jgi:hypothetical protein